LRVSRGIKPGVLTIQEKDLPRRRRVGPMHLSRLPEQEGPALFPVDAHAVKAFREAGAQGVEAVVVLVHSLRQLWRGQQKAQQQEAYWMGWEQFVPPAISALMSPAWSMQKPRCPDFPIDCGTAVASYEVYMSWLLTVTLVQFTMLKV
jgi:hypothetical protein